MLFTVLWSSDAEVTRAIWFHLLLNLSNMAWKTTINTDIKTQSRNGQSYYQKNQIDSVCLFCLCFFYKALIGQSRHFIFSVVKTALGNLSQARKLVSVKLSTFNCRWPFLTVLILRILLNSCVSRSFLLIRDLRSMYVSYFSCKYVSNYIRLFLCNLYNWINTAQNG